MNSTFQALNGWLTAAMGLVYLLTAGLQANEEPPLPTWEREAVATPQAMPGSQFSNLLPENSGGEVNDGFFLQDPGILKSPPLLLNDADLSSHDLSLFLKGGLLNVPKEVTVAHPTPSLALQDVPVFVLDSLKNSPVNEYLINPQSLVTEMPLLDLERLMQFHASECRIRLYILVLDRDQKLASLAALNPLIARLGTDREICLAIYPLGEPWRARFMVSPLVSKTSSLASLAEMAQDCIDDAQQVNDAEQQLQRFAVRLSTRLFWLEKSLPVQGPAAVTSKVAPQLTEVATSVGMDASSSTFVFPFGEGLLAVVVTSLLSLAAVVGLFLGLRFWVRFKAARKIHPIWVLPEREVQPRLGGAFSGGAGAVIHYRPKTPPVA